MIDGFVTQRELMSKTDVGVRRKADVTDVSLFNKRSTGPIIGSNSKISNTS